jgi:hypothetical protein
MCKSWATMHGLGITDKIVDAKSTFYYHQVSKQYAEKCLSEIKAKTVSEHKTENLANGQSSVQESKLNTVGTLTTWKSSIQA